MLPKIFSQSAVVFIAILVFQGTSSGVEEDWQKGEKILPADKAPVDAPLRREDKSTWYQLSNLRKTRGKFGPALAFDFQRVKPPSSIFDITLVLRTKEGRVVASVSGFSPLVNKDQGTFEGEVRMIPLRSKNPKIFDDLELWIEERKNLALGQVQTNLKVSNSITMGEIGEITLARHWKPDEEQFFKDLVRPNAQPEKSPPEGYPIIGPKTKLLPGMRAYAFWRGEWIPAEIIEIRTDGNISVLYSGWEELMIHQRNQIAVKPDVLEAGIKNPDKFKATVRVLPSGTLPLEDDYFPLEENTTLVPGTPVKVGGFSRGWVDATIISFRPSGKIVVRRPYPVFLEDIETFRHEIAISKETLEQLKRPDAKTQFEDRVKSFDRPEQVYRDRIWHPIEIAIPPNAEPVTEDMPLRKGMRLGVNRGIRWCDVTVREVNPDGTVFIHWEEESIEEDGDIGREDLIIMKSVAKKFRKGLNEPQKGEAKSAPKNEKSIARYCVVIQKMGPNRVGMIRVVKDVTGLSDKDAGEFLEAVPFTLKQNLTKSEAERIRKRLEEARGSAVVELQMQ